MKAPSALIVLEEGEQRALLDAVADASFAVESVSSGAAALMHLAIRDFDCVVLGSPIRVVFGDSSATLLEVFGRVAPGRASRIIVLTDAASTEIIELALKMEVHAVFLAPFSYADLRDAMQACLHGEVPSRRLYGSPPAAPPTATAAAVPADAPLSDVRAPPQDRLKTT